MGLCFQLQDSCNILFQGQPWLCDLRQVTAPLWVGFSLVLTPYVPKNNSFLSVSPTPVPLNLSKFICCRLLTEALLPPEAREREQIADNIEVTMGKKKSEGRVKHAVSGCIFRTLHRPALL